MTVTTKTAPVGDEGRGQAPPVQSPPPAAVVQGHAQPSQPEAQQPQPVPDAGDTPQVVDSDVKETNEGSRGDAGVSATLTDSGFGSKVVDDEAVLDVDDERDSEIEFPLAEMSRLDEMINRPRWVVPVLPRGELEILLDASIELCRKGLDTRCEGCQRFFRDGLTISFTKILTDEAVSGWKSEIQRCILKNTEKLIELCVLKLDQDWFPLLDMLALAFNPSARFHMFNASRPSDPVVHSASTGGLTSPTSPNTAATSQSDDESFVYACSAESRVPKGWLCDLINLFGSLNGFELLMRRFERNLSVPIVAALIRPFGNCYEVLTAATVKKYFTPIIETVSQFLEQLTDEELKRDSKSEGKNDMLSVIVNALKCLASRLPKQEQRIRDLEMFRLNVILRLLQISSFNGKMNALNEVNKLIANVSYNVHKHNQSEFDEWLTADKVAEWISKNNVLSIVLRDSLHQPQYVEKLEKIVRFMIKEKALTLEDLDRIWDAQIGKHEAIVKNVHDLLAKLAWDFSPQQLDHLFECFQVSWQNASKKQREKLLELIRRLAEDDKEGIMANKVLTLLWNLAQSADVTTDIMDQALAAHIKILDYSSSQVCVQDRDSQKFDWISKFVDELNKDRLVIPALKQIREICQLFTEAPQNYTHGQRNSQMCYRNKVINELHTNFSIVIRVANSLVEYMTKARAYANEHSPSDPSTYLPDGRFNHIQQVSERLRFLRFLLKDGQLWLCKPQANEIWSCLAENAIYPCDREQCFKWFSKLMGDEPDLDPDITSEFFQQYVLKFDPALLTESGMICFERFFRQVNSKEGKLIPKRRGGCYMDDLNLIGIEYLWKVVSNGPDEVTDKAIILLKDIYTNLGPRLQAKQVEIHEDFLQDCMNRLKAMHDTVKAVMSAEQSNDSDARVQHEAVRMIRILSVLRVYVAECDESYVEERAILPLHRACRGKHITLIVRFPNQGRQAEDVEVWSHTNDTIASVRRQLVHRAKSGMPNLRAELYLNGELIDTSHDRKLISALGIRDKTQLTAKLVQVGSNNPSSPESSSGSSTGSLHQLYDGPNIEAESCLPGVLMAHRLQYTEFLFSLTEIGTQLGFSALRDAAKDILRLLPADAQIVERLRILCADIVKAQMSSSDRSASVSTPVNGDSGSATVTNLESLFFNSPPTKVFYYLEVIYSLLMPAYGASGEESWEFQNNFMLSGGVPLCLKMITSPQFMSTADLPTKRSAYLTVLKISKLLLTAVGYAQVQVVAEACQGEGQSGNQVSVQVHSQAVLLQKALQCIPSVGSECVTRSSAMKLGHCLSHQAIGVMPDFNTMLALEKLSWCAGGECLQLVHSSYDEIHSSLFNSATDTNKERQQMDSDDVNVCREALEVLTVSLALCPEAVETMHKEKSWQAFIIDLLLLCRSRCVRASASEQFYLIATRTTGNPRTIVYFITLLFTVLSNTAKDFASQSTEYFQLLCRLLSFSYGSSVQLPTADSLLNNEIIWLKKIHEQVQATGILQVDEALLDGHLGITKELVSLQKPAKKYFIGCETGGHNLLKELIEDFVFTSSKVLLACRREQGDIQQLDRQSVPVCKSPQTIMTCLELLVCLVTGCLPNLKYLAEMMNNMFYSGNEPAVVEWEYIPPVGPRPSKGFVGLKNAGATCYMNSVLQQLFMIDQIRDCILAAEGAADDSIEAEEMDEKCEPEPQIEFGDDDRMSRSGTENENKNAQTGSIQDERKEYHIKVLRYVQLIFAHLAYSKLQYYVPKGFWKHFRLQGEQVNLREQHDALEFFNSLVDSLDEALKAFNYKPMLTKVLGGSFADQKICKGCPHRYSREEPFTSLNIDIRNHQNLVDSLEQYVKGDLLEGANAYHCEKCNKKVDTVKRLCIKKLPPILAIQLKRFDYDWERECAMKFNDYFEFSRDLDMAPYTVEGLAKIEGEAIADENEDGEKESESSAGGSTKYRLVGVVVHSGQASGGHYYSYILHRYGVDEPKWYKFDDGEVTECKMDDDEEMKTQCFGGEYMGEVFDHMLKRMSYRKQKRWWNAYILFYEQINQPEDPDTEDKLVKSLYDLTIGGQNSPRMPVPVERCVRKQNIQYLHNKNQYCPEYFRFMRRLLLCNSYTGQLAPAAPDDKMSSEAEEISMISVQLVSTFLFNVGFHTKKTLRGAAGDWYEALAIHLRHSRTVRNWFIQNVLFANQGRIAEYLLECPSTEVRNAFMRLIVFVAHFSLQDGPCPPSIASVIGIVNEPSFTASHHILLAVLQLLKKDVSEHGRHLTQYFNLFQSYANLGIHEKQQLLSLHVPEHFMSVTMDDGSIPSIKYQYAELNKLYTVVSQLVRCCDVTVRCTSSIPGKAILPNPYGEATLKSPLMKIQPNVAEMLFDRPNYVKKLIQDCNNYEETTKLLRFCCWENPRFSVTVLSELLWQVAYSCTYELKPYLDLLLQTLKLEDSWQNHRIHNALKGIPDERDGLFDTIHISRSQYQKRAYQCIKMMVLLFSECQTASDLLAKQVDLRHKFTSAVDWLQDELERRPYPGNAQYAYNNWSAQAQSNETSNGYFLERSNSAKLTLAKALELCHEEETDEVVMQGGDENGGEGEVSSDEGVRQSSVQPNDSSVSNNDSDTSSQGPSSANSTTTLTDAGGDGPPLVSSGGSMYVNLASDGSPPGSPLGRSAPLGQAKELNTNSNNSDTVVDSGGPQSVSESGEKEK